jgi:SAM-dependent methyltransferase
MLDPAQALAYAQADFAEPHEHGIATLRAKHPDLAPRGRALDLGCGPGDMTIRLARALADWTIDAVDGSPAMLALAREAVVEAGVVARVAFHQLRLPDRGRLATGYDLVFSNSLLHHLGDPATLWSTIAGAARPQGAVFVMDLSRPASDADVRELVERYAAGEPRVLRDDFRNSLHAAYRPDEVRAQIAAARLDGLRVESISDRHLVAFGHRRRVARRVYR